VQAVCTPPAQPSGGSGRRLQNGQNAPAGQCSNANGGKIFGIPFNSRYVLVIDPSDDSYDATTISVAAGTGKWWHGARSHSGLIYGIPYESTSVLVIDPARMTTSTIEAFPSFRGGVFASGSIFGMPAGATSVLKVSVYSSTASTIGTVPGTQTWDGAVQATNGIIYGIPSSASAILAIDPSDDSVRMIESCAQRENAWSGGVLGPNGLIYSIPYASAIFFDCLAF
jgi:hypothetical protein